MESLDIIMYIIACAIIRYSILVACRLARLDGIAIFGSVGPFELSEKIEVAQKGVLQIATPRLGRVSIDDWPLCKRKNKKREESR